MIVGVKRSVDTVGDRSVAAALRCGTRVRRSARAVLQARRPEFQMALIVRCSSTDAQGCFDRPVDGSHQPTQDIRFHQVVDATPFRRRFSRARIGNISH